MEIKTIFDDGSIEFSTWLDRAMKNRKLKAEDLSDGLGYSAGCIRQWRNGKVSPKLDVARDIANYFGYEICLVRRKDSEQVG